MKILYYSPHPHLNLSDPSGYATHMREMIEAFKDNGHEVETLIMGGEVPKEAVGETKSLSKRFLKAVLPKLIWESLKDYALIQFDKKAKESLLQKSSNFKPDVIYERFNYLQSSGSEVASLLGIRHFVEVNSPYIFERKQYQGNSAFLSKALKKERLVFSRSYKLVVVSSTLRDDFMRNHRLDEDKFIVTPNAVNLESIHVDRNLKEQITKTYDLQNYIVIGFVGSIADWHGIDILISAFIKLDDKNLKLLIVGGGEKLSYWQKVVEDNSMNHYILFTDKVEANQVFTYIDCMDIAILPKTNNYMSPIKLFEYGIMQKAIIAPNVQSVKDVMKHKEDGMLIEPSEEGLSEAIRFLTSHKNEASSMAKSFCLKVKNEHTWKKMAKKIIGE
jgi:glycosyltransferase involved in cell wall biosynthesis